MVRRIASQVHKQASRLTRAGFLKTPPVWYQAVLDHPPLPLPPREPPSRTSYDDGAPGTPAKKGVQGPRLLPISYVEDGIRRQFFRDHPFEAFRPRSITEAGAIEDEHPTSGLQWTRLNQRSRNPSPEDAVRFALNLHQSHGLALSDAYATSVAQFRTLRAVQHVATRFAAQSAAAHGARFGPSATTRGFEAEGRVLAANELKSERMDDSARLARRRWRMIAPGTAAVRGDSSGAPVAGDDADRNAWSRGEEYVRLWREGVRVDYSPALTEPIVPVDPADYMGTRRRPIRR
ncbi:mitochondrial ribosomal protein S25-domain-containing protein [Russula earlei]|uniref:Mitochondrial ribosomal protein S25-domain-containing protein n=1 Tax=Russula earlei TaxID=71964 RepID=A0ACC0U3H7_9AGAM|nr:mitochondrial ribosomal protein S25-domain-containing protein [Russula earlei]